MEAILVIAFIAPSWIAAFLYLQFGVRPHLRSPELRILNSNLQKVGKYWSNSDGNFKAYHEGALEDDHKRMYRSFLIMTALLSILSIVGMFLLILLFISGRP